MDNEVEIRENFVHLARIALSGRQQDIHSFLRRITRRSKDKELTAKIVSLLRKSPTLAAPLRGITDAVTPVDSDSRFHLIQVEESPSVQGEPFYEEAVQQTIDRLVAERKNEDVLLQRGLEPTKTVLLTGPPGVGKTLTARWVAHRLEIPLLILDLSSVMSSYLGRTGSNLRRVLDYAKSFNCVLLLDELDAVAKRRDDTEEIGELKRLVTALIQQLDDWPSSSLLIAATNHSNLLDPAIWRRFEELVKFSIPSQESSCKYLESILCPYIENSQGWADALSIAFTGLSFGDMEHRILASRRSAAIYDTDLDNHLASLLFTAELTSNLHARLVACLDESGLLSKQQIRQLKHVSQNTDQVSHLRSVG